MRKRIFVHLAAVIVCASALLWAKKTDSPATPVPGTGNLKHAKKETKFTFIVAGDSRPKSPDIRQQGDAAQIQTQIFAAAKKTDAAFVVWTGDAIYGLDSADPKAIGQQYQDFFALAVAAGVPVFLAPGNHEMDVKVKHDADLKEIGSAAMEKLYRKNMGIAKDGPIYGTFSYGNALFLLLNSEEIPPADVTRSPAAVATHPENPKKKVNLDPGYISPEQMKWLSDELAANQAVHTFLFMHHPVEPKKSDMGLNKDNAKELKKLFEKYNNISYVFTSHEHLYYNPQTGDTSQPPSRTDPSKDPPYYLVSGGAGAPLSKGGFYNYLVVSVDGDKIQVQMVQLEGGTQ